MTIFLPYIILSVLIATPFALAYKIDDSCNNYYELVHDSLEAAFDMAAAAEAALRDPLQRNPNDQRLAQILFNPEGVTGRPVNTDTAWRSFLGLGRIRTLKKDRFITDTNEAIIYCNLDRLEKRDDGLYYDADMNAVVEPTQIGELKDPGSELASTFKHSNNKHPAQITINTWFLQWAYHARYQRWNDWSIAAAAASILIPLTTLGWPLTPIDALTLLDKVLLHELTHTDAGGSTNDCSPEISTLDVVNQLQYAGKAYGWLRAKFLAGHAKAGHADSAQNNADSLALFASGVRLRQLVPARYITDAGAVVSANPLHTRFVPVELRWPSSSVAFENFINMIKHRNAIMKGVSRVA
ncbi:hypothetical protein AMS68_007375 [Peltaster fructicola]|uniref:Uncharacterized protein n=1 Tax=Peltaster fructicola TaxID=286661 RepID=A0A6H0Y4T9_9PEZI|nr:hypothetical protein AMS68_007375 [Peltaster fructicola]